MPRIATSGWLTIGVNDVPPMPPRLVTENTPPDISSRLSFLSRAFCESVAELDRDLA